MTIAIFVNNESDAACLIPWGVQFAHSDHSELLIVCPRKSKGKRGWDPLEIAEKGDNSLYRTVFDILEHQDPKRVVLKQAIAAGESSDMDRVAIETRELVAPCPEEAFVEEIGDLGVRLLLLPAHVPVQGAKLEEMSWAQKLFMQAPCQVAIVRGAPPECETPLNVMIPSHGETAPADRLAITRGLQLVKGTGGEFLTLLYVRPDDDIVAKQVGEKHLSQLAKGVSSKNVIVEKQVQLADSLLEGINQANLESVDLVMTGTRSLKTIRSLFRSLGQKEDAPRFSVIAIRESVPLSARLWTNAKSFIRSKVPQLDRELRVTLVDRLLNNSKFDFDFVALISLSTLIAALGLVRNSAAVVIGAMLVAPLMTPLVGMGFALVQGNDKLIRSALKSVVLGFTVALSIGAFVGLMLTLFSSGTPISPEMEARGLPNLLDLVVALASGVAGAYAMGRPNLISALPGVAIAAALVPPIATAGLALTMGDLTLSGGATLLFLVNIIAIVLGTAITFWCVGISTRVTGDRSEQNWPRYWFLGFVVMSFLLAAVMSYINRPAPIVESDPVENRIPLDDLKPDIAPKIDNQKE
ncbi:MAG: DUF389 domain-containing protein [Mariniblastus sp.]